MDRLNLRRVLLTGWAVFVLLMVVNLVFSHGSMGDPVSRVLECYLEGPESPDTVACSDVIESGGTQQLYDWNEINLSNAAGNHQALIPDGKLCSAGRDKYAAFDEPRTDWPRTIMPNSGDYTFLYHVHVTHDDGYFELWVTKDGYAPTQPLAWDDIEIFARVEKPPIVDSNYVIDAALPTGKNGHHVIYSIWQRYDSGEAFYACSDVWFGSSPTPSPTAAPNCTAPAWDASTQYGTDEWVSHNNAEYRARWGSTGVEPGGDASAWRIRNYCTSAGGVSTPIPTATYPPDFQTPTPSPTHEHMHETPMATATHMHGHGTATPTPASSSYCAVDYVITSQWNDGFQADVTIANPSNSPIEGWDLTWSHGQGELFESGWNASFSATGGKMSVSNTAGHWNGTINSNGGSITFGFMGSHTGSVTVPLDFAVNGISCMDADGPEATATPALPAGNLRTYLPAVRVGE
ncbi:MAG: lytic polysaccharide monooxygenase [Chloroflexota bacterium]